MLNALLIDDERPNVENLRALLETYCPEVVVRGTALNADEARSLIHAHPPDLLFLDVQMPHQNGFDLLRSLPAYTFAVIFVTAYDQYAIQALRFAAVDYLLKPVSVDELRAAVGRVGQQRRLNESQQILQNLVHVLQTGGRPEEGRIALPTTQETRFVRPGDIVRCESSNNYTTFHLADGESLLVCKPIYLYDELLSGRGFVRCHQSHLVNTAFIKSWQRAFGDVLRLTDGTEISIARGKKEALKKALRL